MKRVGYLYEKIIDLDNLRQAEKKARKRKQNTIGVRQFDEDSENLLNQLHETLRKEEYKTSEYHVFKIYEPKERTIYRLPYYPDRIVHHALLNILEPIYRRQFISGTFSCIKGRGIHACVKLVKKILRKHEEETKYCLKLDIKKFYPSIDHKILKDLHRKIIKDEKTLKIIDEIIDSVGENNGVPIGNYLSQYFANFYLTYFDHWLKENLKIKYYIRYADDMVILGKTKKELQKILRHIKTYLKIKLKLDLKQNYQIFPVKERGINFVGYVFYHNYTKLRKTIKQNLKNKIKKLNKTRVDEKTYLKQLAPWFGWLKYGNCKNLKATLSKRALYNLNYERFYSNTRICG